MNTIQNQFWKTFMERQPHGTNGVSKTRRIPHMTAKKSEKSYKVNENNARSHEKTIQQEKKEPLRVKGWE